MKKGGIAIREFEKLSDDRTFRASCERFKSRLNGEDAAREYAGLSNLNGFKDETHHDDFVKRVDDALDFIRRRRLNKALRKAKNVEGVNLVYEDEVCFIVSPDGPESSHLAAYLDNGTANWCIALPDAKTAGSHWKHYDTAGVFYIYLKGGESWALLVDRFGAFMLRRSPAVARFPSIIANRKNNIGTEPEKVAAEYARMLSLTGLSDELLRGLALNAVPMDAAKLYDRENPVKYLKLALMEKEHSVYFDLLSATPVESFPDKRCVSQLFTDACFEGRLDVLKHLVETVGIKRGDPDGLLIFSATEHIDCFRYLLDLGVDTTVQNPDNHSLIQYVLLNFSMDFARELISRGVDPSKALERLSDASSLTIVDENLEDLKYLVSLGFKPPMATLVRCACGAIKPDKNGKWKKRAATLRYIFERGHRFDPAKHPLPIIDDGYITRYNPLAILFQAWSTTTLNTNDGSRESLEDFEEGVELLLKMGFPVGGVFHNGWSLLNSAVAMARNPRVVKALLDAGAKPGSPIMRKLKMETPNHSIIEVHSLSPDVEKLLATHGIPIEEGTVVGVEKLRTTVGTFDGLLHTTRWREYGNA